MAEMRFTILGCGSSGGVPRLGGDWGDCDPNNSKNRRQRCSLLVQRFNCGAVTTVLIDTSPDMRNQLLSAGIGLLDSVVFSHSHADHVHGIDDLRVIVYNRRERLPVWADEVTKQALFERFSYAFFQAPGSSYPPILEMNSIESDIKIDGAGGPITLRPFTVNHGAIDSLGFRIGDVAYLPDAAEIHQASWPLLENLECWIVDALRRNPHPTHAHLGRTLEWIERVAPKRAVLTNMHNDLDYATLEAETPDHITPAYDGMTLTFQV